jgi:hypothetical protein
MGFMDKAKKMAEQAQAKLDEAQKQFNQGQGSGGGQAGGAPPVQYDQHGRPIAQAAPPAGATPPHGDPLGGAPASAPPAPPAPAAPPAPPAPPAAAVPAAGEPAPHGDPLGGAAPAAPAPHGDPLGGAAPAAPPSPPAPQAPATPPGPSAGAAEDRNRPSYEPPKMSSGDPLAG